MVALTIGQRVAEDRMIHNMVAGDIVVEEVIPSTSDDEEEIIPTTEAETKDTTSESTTADLVTVEETTVKPKPSYDVNANVDGRHYSLAKFRRDGEYYDSNGYKFTWYSETVLPGPGLNIPGRHVNDEGYVCDEEGNICLASTELAKGTVVKIPFGNGIGVVYDKCVTSGRVLDVYIH